VVPRVYRCRVFQFFCDDFNVLMNFLDIPSMPIDDVLDDPSRDDDLIDPDVRRTTRILDSRRQGDGELSDSDDEGDGGRRNHAHHRDHDSSGNESHGGRKFGMGMGIMSSGQSASTHHGAGPSGHTTVARLLSAANAGHAAMDVDDTPSTSENGIAQPEPSDPVAEMSVDREGQADSDRL
jgi:histone deacetylase 1/2